MIEQVKEDEMEQGKSGHRYKHAYRKVEISGRGFVIRWPTLVEMYT
jgi:hypothetical protein